MKFHPPRESVLSTRFLYNKGGCASSLFQVWYWHKSSWNSAIGIHPKSMNQSWLSTKHTQLVGSIYLPLQGTKISHLGKRKIIFPATFKGDMFVPRRVYIERGDSSSSDKVRFFSNTKAVKIWTNPVGSHSTTGGFRDSPSCCESKPLPHATHCSWYSIWAKRAKLSKNRGTVICWKKTFEFRGGAWTKPLEGFLARSRSLEPQTWRKNTFKFKATLTTLWFWGFCFFFEILYLVGTYHSVVTKH